MPAMGQPAEKWYLHSYRFGVLFCELLFLGILVYEGGPFWPPYLLLAMIAIGVYAGLGTTAFMRRLEGLPIRPRKSRARPGHITSDPELQRPDERDGPGEARA